MRCKVCGKTIIGGTNEVCHICDRGISPEAVKLKKKKDAVQK